MISSDAADAEHLTSHPTTACTDCVNAINAHHFLLQSHLEAENLHSFGPKSPVDHKHSAVSSNLCSTGRQKQQPLQRQRIVVLGIGIS